MNSQTDFVAKGEDFRSFLTKSMKLLLEKGFVGTFNKDSEELKSILKNSRYDSSNTIEEAQKLLIAKMKENVEFSFVESYKGSFSLRSPQRTNYRRLCS